MPQEGQITLDGRDIRQLAANELRATFSVVLQETVLFFGTVYDNLAMAHPHASFEDVIAALSITDGVANLLVQRGLIALHRKQVDAFSRRPTRWLHNPLNVNDFSESSHKVHVIRVRWI